MSQRCWRIEIKGGGPADYGAGYWNARVFDPSTGKVKEISGESPKTNAMRMELTAVYEGLLLVPHGEQVVIAARNAIVVNVINGSNKAHKHHDLWSGINEELRHRQVSAEHIKASSVSKATKPKAPLSPRHKQHQVIERPPQPIAEFHAEYSLFTDGACVEHVGGWAFLLHNERTGEMTCGSGHQRPTTNNRMELLGPIEGLKYCPVGAAVKLISDSQYVIKGLNEWRRKWERNNWRRGPNSQDMIANPSLWKELAQLADERKVLGEWVRGHNGHEPNEWCDHEAMRQVDISMKRTPEPRREFPCLIPTG